MNYDFTTLRPRGGIGAEKWGELEAAGVTDPDVIPFSVADMDLLVAPEIVQAIRKAADFGVYGYTGMDDAYRQAVCAWMARRHSWTVDPAWLVNAFGVVHAMGQALHAFTQPGDGVIYQTPTYPPFRAVTQAAGRTLLPNALLLTDGGYQVDFDDLEALCARPDTKLFFLCSPHNPTGRVWTEAELRRMGDICLRHGVLVFSDEIHFDFVHPPHRHTVYAALGEPYAQNCLIATAASKTFNLAGLSTANIILPNPELRRQFQDKATGYTGYYTGYFGLAATRAAYEEGAPWLDALLEHLRGNYDYACAFLRERFPSVRVLPMEGTYLMWADFSSLGLDPQAQEDFMTQEARLFLDEGTLFGPEGAGFERFVLACPRRHLQKALERLDAAAERRGLPR